MENLCSYWQWGCQNSTIKLTLNYQNQTNALAFTTNFVTFMKFALPGNTIIIYIRTNISLKNMTGNKIIERQNHTLVLGFDKKKTSFSRIISQKITI